MANIKVGQFFCWLVIYLLTLTTVDGQTSSKTWETKVKSLIPNNYEIKDLKFGHLNNDTLTDAILIIKSKFEKLEDSIQRDQYRPLLIVIQQNDKSFKVAKRNDHIVLCKNCGGAFSDPYEGLYVENKTFQIIFSGGSRWRWTREIEFGYDPGISNWVLLNDSGDAYDGLQEDTVEYPKNIIYTSLEKRKTVITIDSYKGDN
jgi:hypothetical protein